MKIISTRTHGILDYIIGAILIVAPWVFGFAAGGAETWIPVILGVGVIAYSLLTDYEYGAVKAIPMRGHLWLDGIGGLFLAASPWLFGFAEFVFWPHLIFGLLELGAVMMTETVPEYEYDEVEGRRENVRHQTATDERQERNVNQRTGVHQEGARHARVQAEADVKHRSDEKPHDITAQANDNRTSASKQETKQNNSNSMNNRRQSNHSSYDDNNRNRSDNSDTF